jgi:hypothetical protein
MQPLRRKTKVGRRDEIFVPDAVLQAVVSQDKVDEPPHSFYKYPARFPIAQSVPAVHEQEFATAARNTAAINYDEHGVGKVGKAHFGTPKKILGEVTVGLAIDREYYAFTPAIRLRSSFLECVNCCNHWLASAGEGARRWKVWFEVLGPAALI